MKEIETLDSWSFHKTIINSNLYGESSWYPSASKENIKILVDKINELTKVVNDLEQKICSRT